MRVKNVCKHCGVEFVDECYQTFCPNCRKKFYEGTLRICGRCGKTWEVEVGDCGYASIDDKGYPIELCKECEKKELSEM